MDDIKTNRRARLDWMRVEDCVSFGLDRYRWLLSGLALVYWLFINDAALFGWVGLVSVAILHVWNTNRMDRKYSEVPK